TDRNSSIFSTRALLSKVAWELFEGFYLIKSADLRQTRAGKNYLAKMIVNGDISQIDLPRNVKSGLIDAQEKLKNIHQIDFVHFSAKDVVRHPVVAQIIRAYEPAPVKVEEKNQETE
ncbi:MAG: PhoH family protein, partial [Streptococcus sp.]|nr:PhoH family protein [Streptococcus sp.]